MMAKFDDVKIGGKLYDVILDEWGKVVEKITDKKFGLVLEFKDGSKRFYMFNGKFSSNDKKPTLFWNEVKLPSDNEDLPPFNLVEFLKENLKVKKFEIKDKNCCIEFEYNVGYFPTIYTKMVRVGAIYFEEKNMDKVITKLNEKEIKVAELEKAYRSLGWIK